MKKLLIAWAAGVFEGEGCISVLGNRSRRGGKNRVYPRFSLKMTDEDVVRRFCEVVGNGKVYGPRPTKNKQAWVWEWCGDAAAKWVQENLAEFFGTRRSARLKAVLLEVKESVAEAGTPSLHKKSHLLRLW